MHLNTHLKRYTTYCFDKQVQVEYVTMCTALLVCLPLCIDSLGVMVVVCLQAKSLNL